MVFQSHLSFPVCRSRNKNWRRQFKTHKPEISPPLRWQNPYVGCYCDRQPLTLTVKHTSIVYADTITCSGQNEHPRRGRHARGDRQPDPTGFAPSRSASSAGRFVTVHFVKFVAAKHHPCTACNGLKNACSIQRMVLVRRPVVGTDQSANRAAKHFFRMVALADPGETLLPSHLSKDIVASRRTIPVQPTEAVIRVDQPLDAATEQLERVAIERALAACGGRNDEPPSSLDSRARACI